MKHAGPIVALVILAGCSSNSTNHSVAKARAESPGDAAEQSAAPAKDEHGSGSDALDDKREAASVGKPGTTHESVSRRAKAMD